VVGGWELVIGGWNCEESKSFDFKKIYTSIKLTAQQNLNKQN
jgi:hypothetical protein